ncbi:MAG: four helix bundle protein, partial [Planctomycetota bacterium]
ASLDFADATLHATKRFPRESRFLADQLNRAAVSIAANIAEENGRSTRRDRARFFVIARGSMLECLPLLEPARRHSLVTQERHGDLIQQLDEISRMLAGLSRSQYPRDT